MKIFGINFGAKKNNSSEIEEEQDKLYGHHNRDFRLSIKKDKKAIIKYFILTENTAKEYKFQGKIYPSFGNEIKKIVESEMSDFDDEEIIEAFYHTIRLGDKHKPTKKKYPLYQKAYKKIIPDLDKGFYVCSTNKLEAFLLFQILQNNENNKINQTNYEEFIEIRKFLIKSWSYQSFPAIRENKEKFIPFIKNKLLMERIQKGLPLFLTNDRLTATAITLLLLCDDEESKEVLKSLSSNKLSEEIVGFLGSFYKDFQNNESNNRLLVNLYNKFPKEWVDKHENKFKEMFG